MATLHTEEIDKLFDAILSLETREECYKFFDDALTPREVLDIAQRLKAAEMLKAGKSYTEVCAATGMSTATISRVSKALESGAGGYEIVMQRTGK
ncbi:MAG: TrpR YerC/YecD [Ruminococcaceae bacterium]|nr:TrpR YerC/YecD [Oscillospiraceae bacterium]